MALFMLRFVVFMVRFMVFMVRFMIFMVKGTIKSTITNTFYGSLENPADPRRTQLVSSLSLASLRHLTSSHPITHLALLHPVTKISPGLKMEQD